MTILLPTLYLVRSGRFAQNGGRLWDAGAEGYDWSLSAFAYTSIASATVYFFGFGTHDAKPSSGPGDRWLGRSLCCLNYIISTTSLYFVRSGIIDLPVTAGRLRYTGFIGYTWSRSAAIYNSAISATVWWFEFTNTTSRPMYRPFDRYGGIPLCCLTQNYNFPTTPLYFVRSGCIELPSTTGRLGGAGTGGYAWSVIATSKRWDGTVALSAHYLRFDATGVGPSGGPYYRWVGRPLRCLTIT